MGLATAEAGGETQDTARVSAGQAVEDRGCDHLQVSRRVRVVLPKSAAKTASSRSDASTSGRGLAPDFTPMLGLLYL
ncbi:MAG: hypothetical protein EBT09_06600 [Actinobacteria bacterium]|nr:hypothetical protein [Actinomycetota bacterium]